LDDDYLEDLKEELIYAKRLAAEEEGRVLVWLGDTALPPPPEAAPVRAQERPPLAYTPAHLAEKIVTTRPALAGERKQVTVLFADLKDSTELIRGLERCLASSDGTPVPSLPKEQRRMTTHKIRLGVIGANPDIDAVAVVLRVPSH
jgi:hypothetical protein